MEMRRIEIGRGRGRKRRMCVMEWSGGWGES
jgi:hypothetical protein